MKKILAALLIACMVLSMSTVALAFVGVTTAADLQTAIDNAAVGDVITLGADITTDSKITITKGITLNGNNHTLKYTKTDRAIEMPNGANDAGADGDVIIIKDLNVECSGGRGINYNASSGKLTLENVTVKTTGYAINLPGLADGCEVTIKGGSYTGIIALNVWGANSKITATDTVFTTVDNEPIEGYCAIKLNNDGTNSAEGTEITINGGTINITGSEADDSSFIGNATSSGVINNYTGQDIDVKTSVASVSFNNTTDTYGLTTLQGAVDTFIKYKATSTKITLLRDVNEEVEVPEPIVLDVKDFENKGTIYLTAEDATVIAKEGLNVKSKVVGLAAVYQDDDGAYVLVPGYTITFNANGGRGTMDPETVVKNSKYTLPANKFTAPAGKQFSHWIIEGEEDVILGEKITVNEDITLVAIWKDIPTAKITFNLNGGTSDVIDEDEVLEWPIDVAFTLPASEDVKSFDPAYFVLKGWYVNGETKEPGAEIEITEDVTIMALWDWDPSLTIVELTFNLNGGKCEYIDKDTYWTMVSGESLILPPSGDFTAPAGKQFKAFLINGKEYSSESKVLITADTLIELIWEDIPAASVVTPAAPAAPKTGDNTNIALWMALMAISAVALVGLRKKSKASK